MTQNSGHESPAKLFPWLCPSCLRQEVYPKTMPHTAEVTLAGVVHSVHLPDLELPTCRACNEWLFTDAADERVRLELRRQLCLLPPGHIRALRDQLGFTPGEFAAKIEVLESTVSDWETGGLLQTPEENRKLMLLYLEAPATQRLFPTVPAISGEVVSRN